MDSSTTGHAPSSPIQNGNESFRLHDRPASRPETPSGYKDEKDATIEDVEIGSKASQHTLDEKIQKTALQKRMAVVHLCTVSLTLFNLGWNDGTSGPLLPRLQTVYNASSWHPHPGSAYMFNCRPFRLSIQLYHWFSCYPAL